MFVELRGVEQISVLNMVLNMVLNLGSRLYESYLNFKGSPTRPSYTFSGLAHRLKYLRYRPLLESSITRRTSTIVLWQLLPLATSSIDIQSLRHTKCHPISPKWYRWTSDGIPWFFWWKYQRDFNPYSSGILLTVGRHLTL